MEKVKTELWNDHSIRFANINDEWWALGKDVTSALGYSNSSKAIEQHVRNKSRKSLSRKDYGETLKLIWSNRNDFTNKVVVNELGIYGLIFGSHMPEAEEFQDWVFNVLKELRQATGLEGFEVFATLDKQQQSKMMDKIKEGIDSPTKISYIKANSIANKAISNVYGFDKMIKKSDMTPDMLRIRESILDAVTELMVQNDKFHLNISISDAVYKKYNNMSANDF